MVSLLVNAGEVRFAYQRCDTFGGSKRRGSKGSTLSATAVSASASKRHCIQLLRTTVLRDNETTFVDYHCRGRITLDEQLLESVVDLADVFFDELRERRHRYRLLNGVCFWLELGGLALALRDEFLQEKSRNHVQCFKHAFTFVSAGSK